MLKIKTLCRLKLNIVLIIVLDSKFSLNIMIFLYRLDKNSNKNFGLILNFENILFLNILYS